MTQEQTQNQDDTDSIDEVELTEDAVDANEAQVAEEPVDELQAAKDEAAKNLEGWQRAMAELQNARKRFDKQTQAAYTNATVDVVSKLLPIIDDFDRAIENVPEEINGNSWFDGLNGVQRKMMRILEGINAERIPAVGEVFDPNIHEAIMMEPSDEYESGTVIRELQAGYRIGERVIRPALVYVAE